MTVRVITPDDAQAIRQLFTSLYGDRDDLVFAIVAVDVETDYIDLVSNTDHATAISHLRDLIEAHDAGDGPECSEPIEAPAEQ